ncbi:MAG: sugar phosphate isomerase/epimerase [Oscillospiraceae bacterium]|nr:sugar phosphate isomerase/epimerase [Oscillospiraceae bacterium]
MKLGIINGWTQQDFAYVQSKGLGMVEFCVNHDCDSKEFLDSAPQIKGYSETYGVQVGSIGRWGMERIDENGEVIPGAFQHDKNLIDAASLLGCPVYNCGCNYTNGKSAEENIAIAIAYFKSLLDYAEGKNVKIAVYNCDWANFVITPKQWRRVLGELPDLGIKYDVSHCVSREGAYLEELREWGSRVYHFHLKGSMYIDEEHYDDPPAGLDQTDWPSVMSVLYTQGYDGMVSIEPHSGRWQGARGQWGIDFTIRYITPYIMPEDYGEGSDPYMP